MKTEDYITEINVKKILNPKKAVKSLNLSNHHHLSRAILLENFLLMNTQSRNVSMFFINSLDEYKEAESLAKELGIGFKSCPSFMPDPKGGYHIFLRGFTFIDESKPEEIDSLHPSKPPVSVIDAEFRFSPTTHKRFGNMLEYPFCCVQTYMKDVFSLIDPDERLYAQVKHYKDKNRGMNPNSFYLDEFLPCKPDCEKAAEIGERYENDLAIQINDAVASLYNNVKTEHLKDVESRKMLKNKKRGKKKYFNFHPL